MLGRNSVVSLVWAFLLMVLTTSGVANDGTFTIELEQNPKIGFRIGGHMTNAALDRSAWWYYEGGVVAWKVSHSSDGIYIEDVILTDFPGFSASGVNQVSDTDYPNNAFAEANSTITWHETSEAAGFEFTTTDHVTRSGHHDEYYEPAHLPGYPPGALFYHTVDSSADAYTHFDVETHDPAIFRIQGGPGNSIRHPCSVALTTSVDARGYLAPQSGYPYGPQPCATVRVYGHAFVDRYGSRSYHYVGSASTYPGCDPQESETWCVAQAGYSIEVSAALGDFAIGSWASGMSTQPGSSSGTATVRGTAEVQPVSAVTRFVPGQFPNYKQPYPKTCTATSTIMVVDYLASRYPDLAYLSESPSTPEGRIEFLDSFFTGGDRSRTLRDIQVGLREWRSTLEAINPDAEGRLRFHFIDIGDLDLYMSDSPVVVGYHQEVFGGHHVAAYGTYAAHALARGDSRWLAVRDTWSDGVTKPASNWEDGLGQSTWLDADGITEWWPTAAWKSTPGWEGSHFFGPGDLDGLEGWHYADGRCNIVFTRTRGIPPSLFDPAGPPAFFSGLKSCLLFDKMTTPSGDSPADGLLYDIIQDDPAAEVTFETVAEANSEDMLRLFSPDGSRVGISTIIELPSLLAVYFEYLAKTEGKLGIYLGDELLSELAFALPLATEVGQFDGLFDVSYFGYLEGDEADFKLILSGLGDPEVYVDTLILGEPISAPPIIPEPSTLVLWALGLACIGFYGSRKRRCR